MKKSLTALLALGAGLTVLGNAGPAKRVVNPIAKRPPIAERAAIRLLRKATKAGNAVFYVQFGPSERPAQIIKFESTTLRDDGVAPDEEADDGTHSGYIQVDPKKLAAQQKQLLAAKTLPVFVGRELVGTAVPKLTTAKLSMKDIPVTPNRANFRSTGKKVTIPLPIVSIRPDVIVPLSSFVDPMVIDVSRSLMITDTTVVDNRDRANTCRARSTGVWSFGHLVSEMTELTAVDRGDFVKEWLTNWSSDASLNDLNARGRASAGIVLNAWPRDRSGKLDVDRAPFKLVAIVNRIDLGENAGYGDGGGELRFIYAFVNRTGSDPCQVQPFLVIFEYKVHKVGCDATKAWAQQWKDLDRWAIDSEDYRNALAAITQQVTEAGSDPLQLPNQSSLGQLRTNEFSLNAEWELREFRLSATDGKLMQSTVNQTPDLSFNNSSILTAYAVTDSALIVQDKHTIPERQSDGSPFRGIAAPVEATPIGGGLAITTFFWNYPPDETTPTPGVRHHLSLNTCNGCHGAETATTFTHVAPTGVLSPFLTGTTITDVDLVEHSFNDLLLRQEFMAAMLTSPCAMIAVFTDPSRTSH